MYIYKQYKFIFSVFLKILRPITLSTNARYILIYANTEQQRFQNPFYLQLLLADKTGCPSKVTKRRKAPLKIEENIFCFFCPCKSVRHVGKPSETQFLFAGVDNFTHALLFTHTYSHNALQQGGEQSPLKYSALG